jgi:alpha-ketoglutarate-dependent taurine dioxygenase
MESTTLRPSLSGLRDIRRKAVDTSHVSLIKTEPVIPGQLFPIMIKPATDNVDLAGWARSNQELIESTLQKHGTILFRDFDLHTTDDFEAVASAACPTLFSEYGDLPREGKSVNIYTSTPYPPDKWILFHNESSHLHQWPMKQFFFCIQPSPEGGMTPILDTRAVMNKLDPDVVDQFRQKGLRYIRNFCEGIDVSWEQFFHTDDKSKVEEYCKENGIGFQWKPNNGMMIYQNTKGVQKHPKTGEEVFFNQVQLHHVSCLDEATRESMLAIFEREDLPRNVCWGDGSEIDDSIMDHLNEVFMREMVTFDWQAGDLILLDNMLTSHARMPYSGPRRIAVAMGEIMGLDQMQ